MRIASLLPSATEILYELGIGENLIAVSEDCDYPPETQDLPSLTTSELADGLSSQEIDRAVKEHQHAGRSLYHIDEEVLESLNPDLVLTQEQCEVCAPAFDDVRSACRVLEGDTTVVSLEAHSLSDILENIRTIGELTGSRERSTALLENLRARLDSLSEREPELTGNRCLLTLEWLDPFFAGGHWIPEMVQRLGHESYLDPGDRSEEVSAEALRRYAPDRTVFMPCGFKLKRTVREGEDLLDDLGQKRTAELFGDEVYAVDGSSYFSRPGPRVVDGFEILASILRPERVDQSDLPENAVDRLV